MSPQGIVTFPHYRLLRISNLASINAPRMTASWKTYSSTEGLTELNCSNSDAPTS